MKSQSKAPLEIILFVVVALVCIGAHIAQPVSPDEGSFPTSVREQGGVSQLRARALCTRVIDGDTVELEDGTRVRMIGIDTPETVHPDIDPEPYGEEAASFTRTLLEGRYIELAFDAIKEDRYGRKLAYIYLFDGEQVIFVNGELVHRGLATAEDRYPYSKVVKNLYRHLQAEAQANRHGMWASN